MPAASSVIVVTYNSVEQIDACLSALTKNDRSTAPEIIVVDNASTDDTISLIRARHPDVTVLAQTENRGFAGGVNQGVAAARGECIALLNPDAVARPDWLHQLTAPLADPLIGVTGSKVLAEPGRIQSIGAIIDEPALLPQHRGEGEADRGQYDVPADVWSVHGAAMAFRRDTWQQLGGFDEGFFPAYLEESDFCERARRAGLRVMTAPAAVVEHAEAVATGKWSAQFYYYFLRNRLRYAAKWRDWFALWHSFRPAERERLAQTALLDRRVARLVYAAGVPSLDLPDAAERAAILATGAQLRDAGAPADGIAPLLALLEAARAESVHTETQFRSRWPLLAGARRAWNNVATRWYVRPSFDQQTRYNQALEHAARLAVEQGATEGACAALDSALLKWRLDSITPRLSAASPRESSQ